MSWGSGGILIARTVALAAVLSALLVLSALTRTVQRDSGLLPELRDAQATVTLTGTVSSDPVRYSRTAQIDGWCGCRPRT